MASEPTTLSTGEDLLERILAASREDLLAETIGRRAADQAQTISALHRRIDQLTAELAQAVDERIATGFERDGLARALQRRGAEVEELSIRLEELEAVVGEARARAVREEAARLTVTEDLSQANAQRDELGARMVEAERELGRRRAELKDSEREREWQAHSHAGEVRALRWQLRTLERVGRSNEQALARLAIEHERTTAELIRSTEQLAHSAEDRNQIASELTHAVAAREEIASELTSAVQERERIADELGERVAGLERAVELREETLGERDRAINELHDQLRVETEIAESLRAQLERVEHRLATRATQLDALRKSRSFRFAQRLAAVKHAVLHPRSPRKRLAPPVGETETD